jgi:hypothetical protein
LNGPLQVLEHALSVLDLATAQTARVRSVESRGVRFEPIFRVALARRKANHHDVDFIVSA